MANIDALAGKAIQDMKAHALEHWDYSYTDTGNPPAQVQLNTGKDGLAALRKQLSQEFHNQSGIFKTKPLSRCWNKEEVKDLTPVNKEDGSFRAMEYAKKRFQDDAFLKELKTAFEDVIFREEITKPPEWKYFGVESIPVLLTKEWLVFVLIQSIMLRRSKTHYFSVITGTSGIG